MEKKNLLKSKYYDENKFKKNKDNLVEFEKQKKILKENIENYENEFKELYESIIKEYCKENKIGIIQKYQDIINMLFYQDEKRITDFEKYLKRKKINRNILHEFNNNREFNCWRNAYIDYKTKESELISKIKENKYAERTDDLLRILPQKKYNSFPLKDRYEEIEFGEIENNSVVINFEFSNNGMDWWIYTNLIKMDYKINIKNEIIEKKNIFIKEPKDYEIDKIEYLEKDFGALKVYKEPFCVKSAPYYISTTMEVQNGINEFTLKDKTKISLEKTLDEINDFINEKTKVKIMVRRRMKKKCKEFIENYYKKDNLLKKKIIEYIGEET